MSMKDDTFETSVPPRTSRRPPAPTGSPTTLSEPTFGHLLSTLPAEEKSTVRRIEKILYKINAAETAILFNTTCINEGLLPKYYYYYYYLLQMKFGGGYAFIGVCLFVCLFVCQQDN